MRSFFVLTVSLSNHEDDRSTAVCPLHLQHLGTHARVACGDDAALPRGHLMPGGRRLPASKCATRAFCSCSVPPGCIRAIRSVFMTQEQSSAKGPDLSL